MPRDFIITDKFLHLRRRLDFALIGLANVSQLIAVRQDGISGFPMLTVLTDDDWKVLR